MVRNICWNCLEAEALFRELSVGDTGGLWMWGREWGKIWLSTKISLLSLTFSSYPLGIWRILLAKTAGLNLWQCYSCMFKHVSCIIYLWFSVKLLNIYFQGGDTLEFSGGPVVRPPFSLGHRFLIPGRTKILCAVYSQKKKRATCGVNQNQKKVRYSKILAKVENVNF